MTTPQDPHAPPSGGPPPAGWAGGAGDPGRPGAPAAPHLPTRPGTVVAAMLFWMLAGLTLLLSGAVTIAVARTQEAIDALAEVFAESQVQVSDTFIEQLLIITGVASLIVGLLIVLFGALLLGGANWARITVTVFGVLAVLLVLLPAPFVLLALLLQFLPSANAWFRSRSAARLTA